MKTLIIIPVVAALATALVTVPVSAAALSGDPWTRIDSAAPLSGEPWTRIDSSAPLSGNPWTRIDSAAPVRKPNRDLDATVGE